jgi:hypothetical protein
MPYSLNKKCFSVYKEIKRFADINIKWFDSVFFVFGVKFCTVKGIGPFYIGRNVDRTANIRYSLSDSFSDIRRRIEHSTKEISISLSIKNPCHSDTDFFYCNFLQSTNCIL